MWWLIPIGIAVGLKLIYDSVSDNERAARRNWQEKRKDVERSIEEHRANIGKHLDQAQSSYDFHFLTDLHFSSHKVADSAYRLLKDARCSRNGLGKMIMKSKEQRTSLENQLKSARTNNRQAEINDIINQLKLVNDLRRNLFDDNDTLKSQVQDFMNEVKRLNAQTARLKEAIRDRCGQRGIDWYNRLEERKRLRRSGNS